MILNCNDIENNGGDFEIEKMKDIKFKARDKLCIRAAVTASHAEGLKQQKSIVSLSWRLEAPDEGFGSFWGL